MNIEHFALNVAEPVLLSEWYVTHLGMRVVRALANPPYTRFLADGSGRVVVEVYRQEKAPVPDYFAMDPLVLHIAFVTSDVEEARKQLLAAGATAVGEIIRTGTGDIMAWLRDPWGVA